MLQIGIKPEEIRTSAEGAAYRLGSIGCYDHPTLGYQEFVYGQAAATIALASYACVEATGFQYSPVTTTLTAPGQSGFGSRVGAAMGVMASGDYGWFQIYGKGTVRTSASAAKGTRLNSTATGGHLDDDGTAGSEAINGIVLGTASPGANTSNADTMFTYPTVGATL